VIVLVMGVAGAGKTTVGNLLARELGWTFADADSYHSPENVKKMASGIPLTDDDRKDWLARLRELIQSWEASGENAVLACSALKDAYRRKLVISSNVKLVFLRGEFGLIRERMMLRPGHYMNPDLLHSQFETLEEPSVAEAVVADVSAPPEELVRSIRAALRV
jgi:gluconokinase